MSSRYNFSRKPRIFYCPHEHMWLYVSAKNFGDWRASALNEVDYRNSLALIFCSRKNSELKKQTNSVTTANSNAL